MTVCAPLIVSKHFPDDGASQPGYRKFLHGTCTSIAYLFSCKPTYLIAYRVGLIMHILTSVVELVGGIVLLEKQIKRGG